MAITVTYFVRPDGSLECERYAQPEDVRHEIDVDGSDHDGPESVTEGGVERGLASYPEAVQALVQERWAEWCGEQGERDADARAAFWAD